MADLSHLSPSEYEKITSVLKRDRELRSMEEARIRQLKQELISLRKRAALKPGLDPLRNCARCLTELGRIINRGALCPLCLKKVCKDCRHYGDDTHEWLCIYCFKQMQLKAISGEWMQEFSKHSLQQCAKDSPSDQLRKVLHESQRKGLFISDVIDSKISPTTTIESPPEKPPRSFEYEHSQENLLSENKNEVSDSEAAKEADSNIRARKLLEKQMENTPDDILPKISPWNGIDPEPTIPARVDKSRPLGSVQQYDYSEISTYRERQSSDEGHCTIGYRSRSTSSEVIDDGENHVPVPLPRKRHTPLKKQEAVPESKPVDNQQSSVETTDSDVCSPGFLKSEGAIDANAPTSPAAVTRLSSTEHEADSSNRPPAFAQCLASESSMSETDDEHRLPTKSSTVLFRKVTLKKKKPMPDPKSVEEKHSATSADESGNSLRSSPHRLRIKNRSLSGGSEDGKQRKASVPEISVSECSENHIGRLSAASSEKDSSGVQDDNLDQTFAYHCRSQMSLASFRGISGSVTSVYSAAGGGRYGTVTVTGEVLFGLNYNYKTGTLEINVKECRNLAAVDTKKNRSDPYVKVYLLPDRTKSGKRKTKVKKHTLNPVFDELLKFNVTVSELEIRTLWLSVWHSDRFGRNDFLGEVMLPLGSEMFENSGLKWYPLQERVETLDTPVSYKGDLILALKYVPPDVTSRKFSKKPGVPAKGALEVLVREARNLMATRSNGTSDPFCKSYLLPDKSKAGKQKTPVFKKSCNPKWNHTFIYDEVSLEDLRERCLELTIWDYDKITSNDFLGGVRLCLGTG
ncbi:Synaptotagmin-like protein 5, partial [Stegodyphus mimosarum]